MKGKILFSAITLIAAIGLAFGTKSHVYAEQSNNKFTPMIQGLIERFNLNKDEVNTYLTEQRQTMQEERVKNIEEKLNTAVSNGALTEDQKVLLLNKMEEYRNNKEDFSGMTREEKQQAIKTHKTEMQIWAEENGIDLSKLDLGKFGNGRRLGGFERGICPNTLE